MSTIGGLAAAVSGLYASAAKANAAAANVANVNTEDYRPQRVETSSVTTGSGSGRAPGGVLVHVQEASGGTDIATEFVNLIQAENAYKANAAVIGQVENLYRQLMDIHA